MNRADLYKWKMLNENENSGSRFTGLPGHVNVKHPRFCSNAVLCVSFTYLMFKTRLIRLYYE